jgi:hypothetical protein
LFTASGALSSPIGLGFSEAWRLGLPEPLLDVAAEGIDEQQLASGAIRFVVTIHQPTPVDLPQSRSVWRQ